MYKKLKLLLFAAILSISMTGILPLPVPNTTVFSVEAAATPALNKKTATLNVRQRLQLTLKNNKKKITWSSSNKKVATVSGKGLVTAHAPGTVIITAKAGSKKYCCTIEVKKIKVKKLEIHGPESVDVGKKIRLKASVFPSDASNKKIKWISSNKSIATVSQKGIVTARKGGTTYITAVAQDGSKKRVQKKIVVNSSKVLEVPFISGDLEMHTLSLRHLASAADESVLRAFEYMGFKLEQKSSASYRGYFTVKERKIYLKDLSGTVVYHELGHFLAWISGDRDKTVAFRAIYENEKAKMTSSNRVYSTQNSSEYFAESYREFCINPDVLKKQRPQTYNAIKAAVSYLNSKSDSYLATIKQAYEKAYWN